MAQNGTADDDEIRRIMDANPLGLGPTDQFPEGKLSASDQGEIRIAVGTQDGKVVIHFGEPTVWIGMTPQQAADMGSSLIHKARSIATAPLTVRLSL